MTIKCESDGLENCNSLKLMGKTDMKVSHKDFLFTGQGKSYDNSIEFNYDKLLNSNILGVESLTKM